MKADLLQCPACGEGHMHVQASQSSASHLGQTGTVTVHTEVCDECGIEVAGAASARLNKRDVMRFRKEVEGLLAGHEIAEFRTTYKLTQESAATVFGGGPVAFSKYEKNDVAQSASMDKALRVCRDFPPAFLHFAWKAGLAEEVKNSYNQFLGTATRNISKSISAPALSAHLVRQILEQALKPETWSEPSAIGDKAQPTEATRRGRLYVVEVGGSASPLGRKYASGPASISNADIVGVGTADASASYLRQAA